MTDRQSEYYKDWYQKNRERLAEKRREKYRQDQEYRKSILDRSREWRRSRGALVEKPTEFAATQDDLIQELGITVWTLRQWRTAGLFPRPHRFGRQLWYTNKQVSLLAKLRDAWDDKSPGREERIKSASGYVHANWM